MKTIASIKHDQTINSYLSTLFSYPFALSNLSTFSVYNDSIIVSNTTIFNNFLPFFKSYSVKLRLDPRYYQKPNLLALEYYGAAELEWLVLMVSGISNPIDFTVPVIDILPVSMLKDLNKLITLHREDVQFSKNNPERFSSDSINIEQQVGFLQESYMYSNESRLISTLIDSSTKNQLNTGSTLGNTWIAVSSSIAEKSDPSNRQRNPGNMSVGNTLTESRYK